ncbi:serpin B [Ereboglobus sp. PH5-10]|uniref:serpin family protein n=1 Tax=Ereboglobus sp. PH5-10 TaxID=2940629 RepID=UPI002405E69A|nr:serpin family protein [Ereboglobus sp. PH5-10]MDF9827100.1 serpin B [Ereboglobus sp. PH5-10]
MKLHHLILNIAVGFALTLAVSAERLPRSAAALAFSGNDFACDLYAQLKSTEGNLFFSPFSVSSALAMTYAGAKGDTAAQMQKVLRFPESQTETHSSFAALLKHFEEVNASKQAQLNIANSLWPQKGAPLLEDYLSLVRKNYGAEITSVDFVDDEPKTRKRINQWVEEKTQGKIQNLNEKPFNSTTRLVLVNAVYFKGTWLDTFEEDRTKKDQFFVWDDPPVQSSFMRQTNRYRYWEGSDAQFIELPYKGRELSMLVILPANKTKRALEKIEKRLSSKRIAQWRDKMKEQRVQLLLPKFKMTWGSTSLVEPLEKLGMQEAFIFEKADFSGMNGHRDLLISNVIHKAFVEVNESGSEAAAATEVLLWLGGMPKKPPSPPPVFRADHPFIFLIQDNATGCILFMGRVVNPKE